MYKLKHFFAIILALVLVTGLSTVAFAAEETGIPENATCHTIELTVEPGETIDENDAGISPYIWGNNNYNVTSGSHTYTPQFNIPERYFAYETRAVNTDGSSSSGTYHVQLVRYVSSSIAGLEKPIDGVTYKNDWITIPSPGDGYHFKIYNSSVSTITVYITYYSWA